MSTIETIKNKGQVVETKEETTQEALGDLKEIGNEVKDEFGEIGSEIKSEYDGILLELKEEKAEMVKELEEEGEELASSSEMGIPQNMDYEMVMDIGSISIGVIMATVGAVLLVKARKLEDAKKKKIIGWSLAGLGGAIAIFSTVLMFL